MATCLKTSQPVRVFLKSFYLHRCSTTAASKPLVSHPHLKSNEWFNSAPSSFFSRKPITAASMSTQAEPGVLEIECVPCLSDNYSWLLHDPSTGATAVVDPAAVAPVVEALRRRDWNLTHILNTHHHSDHTGGNEALKARYNATVVGPAADADRIPGIDVQLKDGEKATVGSAELVCFDTPGHTKGHITLYFPASKALFPGDTLFSMGCGRLFEGTPAQMWASLSKLIPLPDDTSVYCAHEYTQSNARFAVSIDADNIDLQRRKAEVDSARERGQKTIPSSLGEEKKINPFLRPDDPVIRAALGVPEGASNEEAFAAIRAAKDRFR